MSSDLSNLPNPPLDPVLVVTAPSAWGGAEVNTVHLVASLLERGNSVVLLEVGPGYYADAFPLSRGRLVQEAVPPGSPELSEVRWWQTLFRRVGARRLVLAKPWVHTRFPALDRAILFSRLPYLIIEHHPAVSGVFDRSKPPHRSIRLMIADRRVLAYQWLQRTARSGLLCVSETTRDALERFEGLRSPRAHVVRPGIDPQEFCPNPEAGAAVRRRLRIPDEAAVVGMMGRLDASKRPDMALRAFAELRKRLHRDSHFLCVGEGSAHHACEALTHELGIADVSHFPGHVPTAERHSHIAAMDCLVSTSELEGLGMVILEAMATGCMVVATDSGGPAEIITEPEHGWLVPQHDARALEEAVGEAVSLTPDARAARVRASRLHVETHFDARRQNSRMAELIEQLQG